MSSKRGAVPARPSPRAKGHGGQRQHLIEACISALHIFGPSRTTVAKVVAIAKMSPGIVRFYFDSKAAMLVASLEFLAAEFEQQVLVPVAKLVSSPSIALELLIDRYVDPHLASPRKVSVWYAFWGEASSRQEYYDICGQKDDRFAALVLELVEGVVTETGLTHLDADGIALGLIGALEILWQDFAFRREQDIDRPAAKRRCMAFLNSVFPGCFDRAEKEGHTASGFRSSAYNDAALLALERRVLFQEAWTLIGTESQVEEPGEFLTADTGAERALVVRAASGSLAALRNNCPASAHALIADRSGRLVGSIACDLHGLRFGLDGKGLVELEMQSIGGLIFIRSPGMRPRDQQLLAALASTGVPAKLTVVGDAVDVDVRADWKIVVEQWLDFGALVGAPAALGGHGALAGSPRLNWNKTFAGGSWSEARYRAIIPCAAPPEWRWLFLAPNQLLEVRADGVTVRQAIPTGPGRCRVHRFDYTVLPAGRRVPAARYLARRLVPAPGRAAHRAAESRQVGLVDYDYAAGEALSPVVAAFRSYLIAQIPSLRLERRPNGG